ncbi:phosphate signaling complex protein PhoU [Desulfolutivibrio sulfoxidireducens]|uniref:phosphate signaling complex protein PhoU n=1 Tax=Desulfolutivibrio sulfoxidireducens TaxID=2773299 RepID=UPI00159E2466|nr:phosphate signaling complex protein PhoU [Desulfolutivibrio sulfoxidireducens]QLA15203.1 phosphate signaling complex protein PhoU [Desulfolutivibrio sulfoxidireducens]
MDIFFQHDLEKLKVDVLTIFHHAQNAVQRSRGALLERNEVLAREVIDGDEDIDHLECAIDAEILRLLALKQPVARDLRFIVGCMRMVVGIERIGDEASGIAARGLGMLDRPPLPRSQSLEELFGFARECLQKTAKAFADLDAELARELCVDSEDALELNIKVFKEMTQYMIDESRTVERAVQLCFVAHSLKRVCDQCSNIAESVIFIKEGACNRHRCD